MKIDAIQVIIPSQKVTNDDILALIKQHSQDTFKGNLDKTLEQIAFSLKYSGSNERYWLAEGETPIKLIHQAINQALDEAKCSQKDIDLLIYTGIGRGFLEPSAAYFIAQSFGMNQVQCFDILDACMSWTRAISLSYSLLKTGFYKRIMIVNAEFNLSVKKGVYPELFRLKNKEQITWSFPGYTLGEATTATIVSAAPQREWEFHFRSRPDYVSLCNVPLDGYEGFCHLDEHIGRNGVGCFTSFGNELHQKGATELLTIFKSLKTPIKEVRAVFPHASSKREWEKGGQFLGIKHLLWFIYPHYGNLVSASVPAGIALATAQGDIQHGDRLVCWVGSAGMSFACYSFIY
jgi:3-oxoacyl-[acyl-carrier-protein] synthase III